MPQIQLDFSFLHVSHEFTSTVAATVKRFYRKTGILSNGDKYEITLDQKRLKTPLGKVFEVKSKPLALAIAHEWDSQKGVINRNLMHLVSKINSTKIIIFKHTIFYNNVN